MNIAVTGASGFLGRHVTAELIRRGHVPVLATRDPLSLAFHGPQAILVQLDLHAPPDDPFAVLGRPDVLIHLAWQGLPNYQSRHHIDHELPAHCRFLDSVVRAGLGTLVVTGTCLEYGITDGMKSEVTTAVPSTPYAEAKDLLRRHLEDLQQSHPYQLVWNRLFYLYGPGQSPQSLLPQLHQAIANGEPTFRMSGGAQTRDFHHVATAAREIVSLALKRRSFGIVNGCSGQPVTVREFVERHLAEHSLHIDLETGYYPYTSYEPFAFWGDATYLHQCLAS